MTDNTPTFGDNQQNSAIKKDGFVDYYELIHEDSESTITRLRSAINDLYNDAQANRDHRNLKKRRSYQELLELLPDARAILLTEEIRHQYDIYREEALSGVAKQNFADWKKNALTKDDETESDGVLGVQEEEQRLRGQEVRAKVLKVAKDKQPRSRVAVDEAETPTAASTTSTPTLLGSAISAIIFFAALIIAKTLLQWSLPVSIIAAAAFAIVVWLGSRFGTKKRTAV